MRFFSSAIWRGCTALEMEIVKAYFELDAATRQKIFEAFERIHSRIASRKVSDRAGPVRQVQYFL